MSMNPGENTRVARAMYDAFGWGDIQAIVDQVSDDVVWQGVVGAGKHVPTSGERRGKAQVTKFFRQVAGTVTFERFEPKTFVAQNDVVVALGHYAGVVKGGGRLESDWAMVFTLRDGKVVRFQEFTDSAAINEAYPVAAGR
jgi:uncharacterized protein